ncbi:mitochondrial distribution and morphology protein-domain-containing protein [Suillus placidus]|uniref:Mitochondrial distribution and morphology protein-domain-containing protein n=1 Tax=Suillus placidus TaxID=48579 RepID=A0A9P6ZVY2_9AGAM|nr:mitochondrial distribution and morphology protein-domain-containing protein [Suillus placidus]
MSAPSSFAFRTLGVHFNKRTNASLLLHSRRGSLRPDVDRYNTIRLFFQRQLATHSSTPVPACRRSTFHTIFNSSSSRSLIGRGFRELSSVKGDSEQDTGAHLPPPPLNLDNYPRLYRRLALSLSHLHRPTRDDFLKVANGFWQRLRIRFKWFTIRSFRKFNADDISAFITWFLMSQTLWILVGTTTFFSVVFATANSLQLQEYVARAISNYLTSETGVTVIFESAIVPKWKDSRISFKNVYVSRRSSSTTRPPAPKKHIGHKAAVGYDVSSHPAYNYFVDDDDEVVESHTEDDANYSMFDLNVDSIDVTLSLQHWLSGKGLVEDAVIKGVRGVLDRRSVFWDPENPLDPAAFRHIGRQGDFEINSLQLEDVLVTVYQPGDFRPYTASIFRADIRTFRKQWLFYDFLRAENVVGQFDNCLFSLHKPQSIGRTTDQDLKDGKWSRMSRIRIDGVNIDHMQNSTTLEGGPLSWITSGKVDAVLDIKFPRDAEDEFVLNAILGELADAITTAATASLPVERIPGQRELAKPPLTAPTTDDERDADDSPKVVIDIDLRFRDLKAAVPLFTSDLSYVNSALIRPIVAFMNAHHTLVPIHCRVVKDLSDYDGAWTVTGLMDEISQKIYDALAYHVSQVNLNRRVKAVSMWSLQMTASAVLSALRNLVDPVSMQVRDLYYVNGVPYDALVPGP